MLFTIEVIENSCNWTIFGGVSVIGAVSIAAKRVQVYTIKVCRLVSALKRRDLDKGMWCNV